MPVYLWQKCLHREELEKSKLKIWILLYRRNVQNRIVLAGAVHGLGRWDHIYTRQYFTFEELRETKTATVLNMCINAIAQTSLWSHVVKSRPLGRKRLINLSANMDVTCSQQVSASLPRLREAIKRVLKVSFSSFVTKECASSHWPEREEHQFKTQHVSGVVAH